MSEIDQLKRHKEELQHKLSNPRFLSDPKNIRELSTQFSRIEKRLKEITHRERLGEKLRGLEAMMSDPDEDIRTIAGEEYREVKKEFDAQERKSARNENLPDELIMEIRAGAGGNEASLFARELFTMYSRYAEKKGWETMLISEAKSDLGGYKEVIFAINGNGAYGALCHESGVHRVQRTPATEKMGRIHTSTASVAVLPKAREVDIEIKPQDIKVEFFRSSGPGGQNVNKVETAVRIYHLPTGLIVTSQDGRSQQKNRETAMGVLRAKLYDAKLQAEQKKMAAERKSQIGTGDRSEKIRTYNFPQDRMTDHRIKQSWHNIPSILEGNIDAIVEELQNSVNLAREN